MTTRFAIAKHWAICGAMVLCFAGPSAAQQRPSLEALESRVEALEAALCSLHPGYGEQPASCTPPGPVCGCNLNTPYPAGSHCDEVSAGDFEVSHDIAYGTSCLGSCSYPTPSGTSCFDDADCSAGEICDPGSFTCQFPPPPPFCASESDCPEAAVCEFIELYGSCSGSGAVCNPIIGPLCPGGETCDGLGDDAGACSQESGGSPVACLSDQDCAPGFTCQNFPAASSDYCIEAGVCGTGGSCGSGSGSYPVTHFSITNVGPPGGPEIANCGGTTQTADEAIECIADIEADLGASCTTLP